jgi:hypothetical protein
MFNLRSETIEKYGKFHWKGKQIRIEGAKTDFLSKYVYCISFYCYRFLSLSFCSLYFRKPFLLTVRREEERSKVAIEEAKQTHAWEQNRLALEKSLSGRPVNADAAKWVRIGDAYHPITKITHKQKVTMKMMKRVRSFL